MTTYNLNQILLSLFIDGIIYIVWCLDHYNYHICSYEIIITSAEIIFINFLSSSNFEWASDRYISSAQLFNHMPLICGCSVFDYSFSWIYRSVLFALSIWIILDTNMQRSCDIKIYSNVLKHWIMLFYQILCLQW